MPWPASYSRYLPFAEVREVEDGGRGLGLDWLVELGEGDAALLLDFELHDVVRVAGQNVCHARVAVLALDGQRYRLLSVDLVGAGDLCDVVVDLVDEAARGVAWFVA